MAAPQDRAKGHGRHGNDGTERTRAQPGAGQREPHPGQPPEQRFRDSVGRKAARKARARAEDDRSIFFWLGMFGMVGWAVAIPTLAGIALGLWLDRTWPAARASWTLTFLLVGVALGVLNAWYWVRRESGGD
jgi:ATP synthase protein I